MDSTMLTCRSSGTCSKTSARSSSGDEPQQDRGGLGVELGQQIGEVDRVKLGEHFP